MRSGVEVKDMAAKAQKVGREVNEMTLKEACYIREVGSERWEA